MATVEQIQAMFHQHKIEVVTELVAVMTTAIDERISGLRSEIVANNTATGTAIQQLNEAHEQLRKKVEEVAYERLSRDEVQKMNINQSRRIVVFGDCKGPNADISQQLQQVKDAIPSHIVATVEPLPPHATRPRKAMATFPSPTTAIEAAKAISAARIGKTFVVPCLTEQEQEVEQIFTIPATFAIRKNSTLEAHAAGTKVKVREANNEQNKRWQFIPYTLFSADDLPKDTNHPILNAVLQNLFPNNTSLKTPAAAPTNDTEMNDQHTPAARNLSGTVRGRPDGTPTTVERNVLGNLRKQRMMQQQERISSAAANTSAAAAAAADESLTSRRLDLNA